jgi:hypothetical protein
MNYSWFILLFTIFTLLSWWNYKPITYSILLILITKIIYDINLFSSVSFKNGIIQESKLYYKPYKGDLSTIYSAIESNKALLSQFKLTQEKIYRSFALYVHSVEGSIKVFKYAYTGIMRFKKTGYIEVNVPKEVVIRENQLEEYLFENQYNLAEVGKTKSIWSNFNLRSEFSVFNVVKKYYNKLSEKISKTDIPSEMAGEVVLHKVFPIMEIYSDSDVNFHIPVENLLQFNLVNN